MATKVVYHLLIQGRTEDQCSKTLKELRKVFDDPLVWTRVWIVQEVSLVPQVHIIPGSHSFEWTAADAITEAGIWEYVGVRSADMQRAPAGILTSVPLFEQRRKIISGAHLPFYELWGNLGACNCTDPRVSVFALLGLPQDGLEIMPDYSESFRTAFIRATRACIKIYEPLASIAAYLPSWVPNFARSDLMNNLTLPGSHLKYNAGKILDWASRMKVDDSIDCGTLTVRGVELGSVSRLIGPPMMMLDWKRPKMKVILNEMLAQLDEIGLLNIYVGRENLNAF
jgi:hypothetical protein